MTPQAVCFDLDDTLYDYHEYAEAGLRAAANVLEARTGESVFEELRTMYFDDDVTSGTFDRVVAQYGLPSTLVEPLVRAYHCATTPLAPYDDTEAILTGLSSDHRLGLITDGRGGHAKLQRLGIGRYFDSVLVTPTIGLSKHDPTVFEQTLADLSVPSRAAVYVGDDPRVDFSVPNDLDMDTVRLRRGRYTHLDPAGDAATPDHEIDALGDLLQVL